MTLDYQANDEPAAALDRAFDYWEGNRRHSTFSAAGVDEIVSLLDRRMEVKLAVSGVAAATLRSRWTASIE